MTNLGGYMGKVLKINLSKNEINEYPWSDVDRHNYLGGKIMAIKIITDLVPYDTKTYDEANSIVISTGPLSLTGVPSSNRFNISTISPLTNLITSSNCGGDFGLTLKKAGYDALIITGIAQNPTWLEIDENYIEFHDARNLWGLTTSKTQERLNKNSHLVIGPAGENLVNYANIITNDRSLGKDGVGAVFGSKHLKVITCTGKDKFKEGCVTCQNKCGRLFRNQGLVVKEKEIELLMKLGSELGISDIQTIMIWKKQANEMGIDTINFVEAIIDELCDKIDIDIEKIIQDIAYLEKIVGGVLYNKKARVKNALKESISATGICLLSVKNKSASYYLKVLNDVTGMNLSLKDFIEIGKRGIKLEEHVNINRRERKHS